MKKYKYFISGLLLLFLFESCLKEEMPQIDSQDMTMETLVVPDNFNYSTIKDVQVSLTVPDYLKGAVFSLIAYKQNSDSLNFAKATFDNNGTFESVYSIPAYIDSILVQSEYLGLVEKIFVPIYGGKAEYDYRPLYNVNNVTAVIEEYVSLKSANADGYTYIGTYKSNGVPNYIVGRDVIEQNLLDDVNATLPERSKVPEVHPEFLANGTETNIVLTKRADVWVTFVAEGAGYRNVLGYYTYRVGQEPTTRAEIDQLKVVFPNASASGSGGGLNSGDKVHLGQFDANTVVAWFLVADGWNGSVVTDGRGVHFSQPGLNSESNASLRNHMVMLWDKSREQFLLGFEDIPRDNAGCDQDFNDLVYYATTNPVDAVKRTNVQTIVAANDSDGDGINDELDDFPYDPNKSFNNYSPSEQNVGTVAYEDLWPNKGDYDFNDLVVNYNFNMIANAQNKISTIEATLKIDHIGGSYRNGFAFILPVASSNIGSVENQVLNVGYVNLNANGTESGVDESVIFVIEDATPFNGKTIDIVVNFSTPLSKSALGNAPFNPFIVVNGERSREVHLPDLSPTSKGTNYLGLEDDYSSIANGRYFKTNRNLPWALNMYSSFSTPPERVSIDKVYPKFITWANSGGTKDLEWYK